MHIYTRFGIRLGAAMLGLAVVTLSCIYTAVKSSDNEHNTKSLFATRASASDSMTRITSRLGTATNANASSSSPNVPSLTPNFFGVKLGDTVDQVCGVGKKPNSAGVYYRTIGVTLPNDPKEKDIVMRVTFRNNVVDSIDLRFLSREWSYEQIDQVNSLTWSDDPGPVKGRSVELRLQAEGVTVSNSTTSPDGSQALVLGHGSMVVNAEGNTLATPICFHQLTWGTVH